MWDVIVCTCQNTESAVSIKKELQIRQKKGLLDHDTFLLAVDDPKPNIGSGSATLNAVLCVGEYLAAKEGMTSVGEDSLLNTRVLILLLGTTFPFSPCGHGFMPHPSSPQPGEGSGFDQTEVKNNIDHMMELLGKLCADTPPGVWVVNTDVFLKVVGDSIKPVNANCFQADIIALTVSATPDYAMLHGVCKITDTGDFAKIIHKGDKDQVKSCIRPDNLCDILAGVVYFSPHVLGNLLNLCAKPPLDACTYAGLDNGAEPLSLSLFFDVLLCLTTEVSYDGYVAGSFKTLGSEAGKSPQTAANEQVFQRARANLWKALKGLKMKAESLSSVEHHYLRFVASDVLDRYKKEGGEPCIINSIMPDGTIIGKHSVLINCNLKNHIVVGSECFLSGLGEAFSDLPTVGYQVPLIRIPEQLTVQEIHLSLGRGRMKTNHGIVVIYGIHDNLIASFDSTQATFCNKPWSDLFHRTGITENDLWLPQNPKTLLHARLFVASHTSLEVGVQETFWLLSDQCDEERLYHWRSAWRISLSEILKHVDCQAEFSKLRDISFELQRQKMVQVLKENRPECFLPFLFHAQTEERQLQILETLDQVAEEVKDSLIVCRVYASIADMLVYMAGEAGIRAGPAANIAWRYAFSLLEEGNLAAGTKALALERANWINNGPDRIIRASRHYERAGQILTRIAVATARKFIQGEPCDMVPLNHSVTVSAPARIDIAGSWTDTPPQAYEWGGKVTTLAMTINGDYPIKVIAKRIPELKLDLVILGGDGTVIEQLELTDLSHLANYSQPHAPGALLKAAFICTDIVQFPSEVSLADQLSKFGSGFMLQSMSSLPQGSGMGTSSILGGAIMAAIWRAAGHQHSYDSLIHSVLHLEQLLTTGGGWQDQCGGLYGGCKISESGKGLPVRIITKQIQIQPDLLEKLNQHLVLVYTGKTRLARNLLQDVLRNWHSREQKIVKNMEDMVANAISAATAVEKGDLKEIGQCLNRCQEQKLVMAPGSLPKVVSEFINCIKEEIYGCTLTGAGGGGFMAILCNNPDGKVKIQNIIHSNKALSGFVVYEAAVDLKGLHYSIE